MIKPRLRNEAAGSPLYWLDESGSTKKVKSPTAYLLPNYDEYFIGFRDRSAIGEISAQANISSDNPALIAHVIILDGQVVGGWRRTLKKNEVIVEASLITTLTNEEKQAVAVAAERFGQFLGLSVSVTYKEHKAVQRKTRSF